MRVRFCESIHAPALAIDDSGYAYVTGSTSSSNYPTKTPFQTHQAVRDAFLTKLAPAGNVHVLATVNEASYSPASDVKMGDHPVIWTNQRMAARNVYIFMGHGPELFENKAFTTILRNALLWAAEPPQRSK